ncbi:hypothetical protein MMC15_000927 [Xylographa vitiligo]|nr:hypothetical protein [Xylographa vitiligo]
MPRPTPLQERQARGLPPPQRQPLRPGPQAGLPASKRPPGTTKAVAATLDPPALTYAEEQRIDAAARVLGSWEALAMHASAASELCGTSEGRRAARLLTRDDDEKSIPQTRLRFEKMLLGVEDEGPEEWEDEVDEPWVEGEEVGRVVGGGADGGVVGKGGGSGSGSGVGEKKGEGKGEKGKGKGTPKKGARESAGRRDEGTFGRLRREREERRRDR